MSSYERNVQKIRERFSRCRNQEEIYGEIISLGREMPPFPSGERKRENLVHGCQSSVYLMTKLEEGRLSFLAEADALISAGLAALLIQAFSGESPETLLSTPPRFLEELGIPAALSPHRANGLFSIHLRMKQEALQACVLPTNPE